MKTLPKFIISVVGCELVGIFGSIFTVSSITTWYSTINKPSFTPPNWLFAPVWTLLYFLMGLSFSLIWQTGWKSRKFQIARNYFLTQLALNFVWSPIFFGLKSPLLGLIVIMAMWTFTLKTIIKFYSLSKWSAYLLVPYLLWISFATLLNAAIVFLN